MDTRISNPRIRRLLPWAAGTLVLATALAFAAPTLLDRQDGPVVQTGLVERGDIEKTVTAVGALKPKDYVDVGTQVSGQLQKVHVEIGDRVRKGDLIAEIDPTRYESTVRSNRATLENQRAQLSQQLAELDLARQQLARNQRIFEQKAVSQDTLDQANAASRVAEAKVAATRAQIKATEATLTGDLANLSYTKIYAPMDGTIASQTTLEGQTVNSVQSAPTIVQVANLDVMTVWAQVAEADVNKLKPDMPAYFTTLGLPDRKWQGKVRQVQPTPETENDVVLYNVLIDVDNTEGLLLPDMTVQVFFVLGEARNVAIAPIDALVADPSAGAGMFRARVATAKGFDDRLVRVGLTTRTDAQILSGLAIGDRVALAQSSAAQTGGLPAPRSGGHPPMGPRL